MSGPRRFAARLAVLALTVAGLVATSATQASACSCATAPLREYVERADGVFVGTVGPLVEGLEHTSEVEVTDVYQGEVGTLVTVNTAQENTDVVDSCDFDLTPGTTRTFFVSGSGTEWTAGACGSPFLQPEEVRTRLDRLLGAPDPPAVDVPAYEPPEGEPQADGPDVTSRDENDSAALFWGAAGAAGAVLLIALLVGVRRTRRPA